MDANTVLSILVVLLVVGVLLWFIQTYVPMAPPIKTILTTVVVLAMLFWLLSLVWPTLLSILGR